MKTQLTKKLFMASILFVGMASCTDTPKEESQKVEEAKAGVADAQNNLNKAQNDFDKEYQVFKDASDEKIKENEKKIEELKVAIKEEKSANARAANQKEVDALDAQTAKLKLKINNFKKGSKDAWEDFKVGFNKDMDELGASISSISLKTKKS